MRIMVEKIELAGDVLGEGGEIDQILDGMDAEVLPFINHRLSPRALMQRVVYIISSVSFTSCKRCTRESQRKLTTVEKRFCGLIINVVIDVCVSIRAFMPYIWKYSYDLRPHRQLIFDVVFCIGDLKMNDQRRCFVRCALENSEAL